MQHSNATKWRISLERTIRSSSVFARSLADSEGSATTRIRSWDSTNHCYVFSARRVNARMKALVKSKGLFLNPSLRRLGIVALRTVEVLEVPTICMICCRRRCHWRKNSLIGAFIGIDKSLVARRRKRAVSLSQNLPEVPLGGGFNGDHRCCILRD